MNELFTRSSMYIGDDSEVSKDFSRIAEAEIGREARAASDQISRMPSAFPNREKENGNNIYIHIYIYIYI